MCLELRAAHFDGIFCGRDEHGLDELIQMSTLDIWLEDKPDLCVYRKCCQILMQSNTQSFRAPTLVLTLSSMFSEHICSQTWILYKPDLFEDSKQYMAQGGHKRLSQDLLAQFMEL